MPQRALSTDRLSLLPWKLCSSHPLALQDDPKYKQAMRVRNPEARLRAFLAVCGSMRTDDSGGQQPKYRMDTFRIMAEFEKPKVCPACSHRQRA